MSQVPAALAGALPVLESAPLGIIAVDAGGLILWTNSRCDDLFGYPQRSLVGQSLEVLVPERLRAAHGRHRSGFFAAPRVRPMGLDLDLMARRQDGTEFPVEISLSYLDGDGGRLALGFITDITARREAEKRLQAEFAVTSVFLESAPADVMSSRLLRVMTEILDWSAAEFWLVEDVLLRREARWPRPDPATSRSSRAPASGRETEAFGAGLAGRTWAAGRALWAEGLEGGPVGGVAGPDLRATCAFPIQNEQRVTGVIVLLSQDGKARDEALLTMLTDVGRRIGQHWALRHAEQELARQRDVLYQAEKLSALGRLVAGVAHEMNNPLGIMSSRIELMLTDAKGQSLPDQLVEDLQVLHRNTMRVAGVAQALRSFARQSSAERRPVDLNGVVRETLLLVGRPTSMSDVQIDTDLQPDLPALLGDANALQQVVLNLLTNAREAMSKGGRIHIETGRAPDHPDRLRLAIADTGPGIAASDLPHIFEPFYTTKPAGTGLGLAVSYGIVQDHQGTIEVQSVPGHGTTFVLTFPVLAADAERL
jgi:PAS domain S-box-containing protein